MVANKIQVQSKEDGTLLSECSWQVCRSPTATGKSWQSLDILFEGLSSADTDSAIEDLDGERIVIVDHAQPGKVLAPAAFGSTKAFQFLLQCIGTANTSSAGRQCLVKLVIPQRQGQIVRADVITFRMKDTQYVKETVSFAEPLQSYNGVSIAPSDTNSLDAIFSAAAAGLILHSDAEEDLGSAFEKLSLAVQAEIDNRLDIDWIEPEPVRRRTLVLVEGSRVAPEDCGTGQSIYYAAAALGIDMVILDNEGHWMQGPKYAHWRKAFIPTRLTDPPEADFAERIVKSVQSYGAPVDGIVTFCDSYIVQVSQAAQVLGLEMNPPEALRVATDKYLTSVFAGHQAYRASSPEEAFDIASKNEMPYPLIIKPCNGWASEGVFRVDSIDNLVTAAKSIDTSRHGAEFVIEKYCEGPEFDANFILLDGEILFFEACDDFPKSGDSNGTPSGSVTTFSELTSVYPSILPAREIDVVRNELLEILLKLGLRDGVMHVEGRVEYSSAFYQTQNGVLDLHTKEPAPGAREPVAWLIEINPRPLGMAASGVIDSTHGIDYHAAAMLIAVGDKTRTRTLSRTFKHGPQYTCIMVFIPADFPTTCQGIYDSDDICAELKARRPDLAKQISKSACLVKRGQKVSHPSTGANCHVAYFNVFSRDGRTEALKLAEEVRKEVRYSFI
jgi:hypothetical protein